MKKLIKCIVLSSMFTTSIAMADISVIVNNDSNVNINKEAISNIFLGKDKSMKPVDLNTVSKDEFYEKTTGKTQSQIKSYWSGLVFSGKGTPPKSFDNVQDVIDYVKTNKDSIGYIPKESLDSSVKSILDI